VKNNKLHILPNCGFSYNVQIRLFSVLQFVFYL